MSIQFCALFALYSCISINGVEGKAGRMRREKKQSSSPIPSECCMIWDRCMLLLQTMSRKGCFLESLYQLIVKYFWPTSCALLHETCF
jgi:hypothetical protein